MVLVLLLQRLRLLRLPLPLVRLCLLRVSLLQVRQLQPLQLVPSKEGERGEVKGNKRKWGKKIMRGQETCVHESGGCRGSFKAIWRGGPPTACTQQQLQSIKNRRAEIVDESTPGQALVCDTAQQRSHKAHVRYSVRRVHPLGTAPCV